MYTLNKANNFENVCMLYRERERERVVIVIFVDYCNLLKCDTCFKYEEHADASHESCI